MILYNILTNMNKFNDKLLRSFIRSIIIENTSDDPHRPESAGRITGEMLPSTEDLAFYRMGYNTGEGILNVGIAYDMSKIIQLLETLKTNKKFVGRVSEVGNFQLYLLKSLVGMIAIQKAKQPCNGAYEVKLAVGPGRGKLVYGMGYHMAKNCYLIPDRHIVSKNAQNAWLKISKSTKGVPLEDHCEGDKVKKAGAACKVWKVKPGGIVQNQEVADALNQAYCKPSSEYDFKEMSNKTKIIINKYNLDPSDFNEAMKQASTALFSNHYEPPEGDPESDDC